MRNKTKNQIKAVGLLLLVICISVFFFGCSKSGTEISDAASDEQTTKAPSVYSWEEFEKLSGEEQISFQNSFESSDEFDDWMQSAKEKETTLPWEKEGAKQPSEYSKDEFDALSGEEQIKFQDTFENDEDFDSWLNDAKEKDTSLPWEKEGAKQPSEYSKDEFDALSGEEQIKFQQFFKDSEAFSEWLQNAESEKTTEKPSDIPAHYTWEEFEKLSGAEQIQFQNSFESFSEFEKWMDEAQSEEKIYPWEKEGAKQPSEYTRREFDALSAEEQIMFQRSFDNEDDFDKWLKANGN